MASRCPPIAKSMVDLMRARNISQTPISNEAPVITSTPSPSGVLSIAPHEMATVAL